MRYAVGDTIAAIATAPGAAGVGVLRVSGPEALVLADAMFGGRRRPSATPGGRFLFGRLMGGAGEVLDEGLCLVFRAPHSYTGEDVAELQAHGSPAVLQALLRRALALGARAARPGEFTERAYRSGRLNLAQAEAVDLLVRAHSEAERRQGAAGLSGELSARVERIAAGLTRTLAAIAALLDYPGEGVPEEDREAPLAEAEAELAALLQTARAGAMLRGARVAIVGRPNAGKSSLLNALVGYGRSIVTPEAGTTRDYLEAPLELGGFPVTLIDTAGLRDTVDPVEAAGVGLARDLAQGADLVLRLEDGSRPREALPGAPGERDPRVLLLRTKTDLPAAWVGEGALAVSAHSGEGLDELQRVVRERLSAGVTAGEAWLTTERQTDAARRALEHVRAARGLPDDLASFELEDALHALAEITGQGVNEEVVSAVFANFCVGK